MKKIGPKFVIAVVAVALVVMAIVWWQRGRSVVPSSILKQVSFVIFYPVNNAQLVIEKKGFKYNSSDKQVSFIVRYDGQSITFGEQGSPDSFSDDSSFYPQFIQSLNGYASFASVNGTVNLVTPTETKNEAGVLNAKGTLLFAQSTTGNLSENAWKTLFNTLVYVQPS